MFILPALSQPLRVFNNLVGVLLILLPLLFSLEKHLFQPRHFQIGLITDHGQPIVSR